MCLVFFFKETATTEIYTYWQTLALHDARPICGLEATLAWSVEAEDGAFAVAARACGLASAEALPAWYGDLMTRCGVERRLPPAFKAFDATTLAAEMRAPENQTMRRRTARTGEASHIDRFAAAALALSDRKTGWEVEEVDGRGIAGCETVT